jgi:hypothetical protein
MEIKELIDFKNPPNSFCAVETWYFQFDGSIRKALLLWLVVGRRLKPRWTQTSAKLCDFGVNGGDIIAKFLLCLNDMLE